jgi:hypothetical protein
MDSTTATPSINSSITPNPENSPAQSIFGTRTLSSPNDPTATTAVAPLSSAPDSGDQGRSLESRSIRTSSDPDSTTAVAALSPSSDSGDQGRLIDTAQRFLTIADKLWTHFITDSSIIDNESITNTKIKDTIELINELNGVQEGSGRNVWLANIIYNSNKNYFFMACLCAGMTHKKNDFVKWMNFTRQNQEEGPKTELSQNAYLAFMLGALLSLRKEAINEDTWHQIIAYFGGTKRKQSVKKILEKCITNACHLANFLVAQDSSINDQNRYHGNLEKLKQIEFRLQNSKSGMKILVDGLKEIPSAFEFPEVIHYIGSDRDEMDLDSHSSEMDVDSHHEPVNTSTLASVDNLTWEKKNSLPEKKQVMLRCIERNGYRRKLVKADGNCFFYALKESYNSDDLSESLRRNLIAIIKNILSEAESETDPKKVLQDFLKKFNFTDDEIINHLYKIATSDEINFLTRGSSPQYWGKIEYLPFLLRHSEFNRPVVIFNPMLDAPTAWIKDTTGEIRQINNENNEITLLLQDSQNPPIVLVYNGIDHFDYATRATSEELGDETRQISSSHLTTSVGSERTLDGEESISVSENSRFQNLEESRTHLDTDFTDQILELKTQKRKIQDLEDALKKIQTDKTEKQQALERAQGRLNKILEQLKLSTQGPELFDLFKLHHLATDPTLNSTSLTQLLTLSKPVLKDKIDALLETEAFNANSILKSLIGLLINKNELNDQEQKKELSSLTITIGELKDFMSFLCELENKDARFFTTDILIITHLPEQDTSDKGQALAIRAHGKRVDSNEMEALIRMGRTVNNFVLIHNPNNTFSLINDPWADEPNITFSIWVRFRRSLRNILEQASNKSILKAKHHIDKNKKP